MRVKEIDWETDGVEVELPTAVTVPSDLEEDEIADYLSDQYGWLVNGFVMEAESFGAEMKLPKLTKNQMDFLKYKTRWFMAYSAYARGQSDRYWSPEDWKDGKAEQCFTVTGDGWGNDNIARRTLKSLLEKKVLYATKTNYFDYDGRIRKSPAQQVNENPDLVSKLTSVCLGLTPIGVEIIKREFALQVKDVVAWRIELTLEDGQTAYLSDMPDDIAQSIDNHIEDVKWDIKGEQFGAEERMFIVKEYPHTITKGQEAEILELLDKYDPDNKIFSVRYGDTMRILSPYPPHGSSIGGKVSPLFRGDFLPTYYAESGQFPSMHYGDHDSDTKEKYQEFVEEWDGDDEPPSIEEWIEELDEYDRRLQEYEGTEEYQRAMDEMFMGGFGAEEYTVVMSGFLTDDGSGEKEFTGTEQELKDKLYDFMMEDRFDKLLWETDGDEEEAERIDLERWNKKSLEQICDDNEYLTLRKSFGAELESGEAALRIVLSEGQLSVYAVDGKKLHLLMERPIYAGEWDKIMASLNAAESFGAELLGYPHSMSDRQKHRIKKLGGRIDKAMTRSEASKYIKSLMSMPLHAESTDCSVCEGWGWNEELDMVCDADGCIGGWVVPKKPSLLERGLELGAGMGMGMAGVAILFGLVGGTVGFAAETRKKRRD